MIISKQCKSLFPILDLDVRESEKHYVFTCSDCNSITFVIKTLIESII